MVVRLSYLLNKAGIKRHVEFSELDAEGNWLEKLKVVVGNAGQRQWHRVMVFAHKQLTRGTAVMARLDGSVRLQNTNYNTPVSQSAPVSNETSATNDEADEEDEDAAERPAQVQTQPALPNPPSDEEDGGRIVNIEDADNEDEDSTNPNEFIGTETGTKQIAAYLVWLRNSYNGNSKNRRSILAKRHSELDAYIEKHGLSTHPAAFEFAEKNKAIVGDEIYYKLYRLKHRNTPIAANGEDW
jgi:hypothetical protein